MYGECSLKESISWTNLREGQQEQISETDPHHVLKLCGVYGVYARDRKHKESDIVHEIGIFDQVLQRAVHIASSDSAGKGHRVRFHRHGCY